MSRDLRTIAKGTPVTIALIAVNVAVFLLSYLLTGSAARTYNMQALSLYTLAIGHWWTLVISMFMHGSVMHILFNMVSLYWLGLVLERLLGSGRFCALYFVSGIAGGLTYVAWSYLTGRMGWAIGASGAIFGLFGAYGAIMLAESRHPLLFPQAAAKSQLTQFVGLLLFNVIYGFTGGIAWQAHFGGLVSGAILGYLMYRALRRRRMGA